MAKASEKPTDAEKDLPINRVAFISLHGDTAGELIKRLHDDGFSVTCVESNRGILLEPTFTVMTGFPESRYEELRKHVSELCQTIVRMIPAQPDGTMAPSLPRMVEAETGGATIAVLAVDTFLQI